MLQHACQLLAFSVPEDVSSFSGSGLIILNINSKTVILKLFIYLGSISGINMYMYFFFVIVSQMLTGHQVLFHHMLG